MFALVAKLPFGMSTLYSGEPVLSACFPTNVDPGRRPWWLQSRGSGHSHRSPKFDPHTPTIVKIAVVNQQTEFLSLIK